MLLRAATISGFRSFRKPVEVFFSSRTTVLIGPNDHGKTNVLLAIDKLGAEREFAQQDVNDRISEGSTDSSHRLGNVLHRWTSKTCSRTSAARTRSSIAPTACSSSTRIIRNETT